MTARSVSAAVLADLLGEVLDAFALPAVIVDREGRLIVANGAGKQLLAESSLLTLSGETVCSSARCPEPITQQISSAPEQRGGRRVLATDQELAPAHLIVLPLQRGDRPAAYGLIVLDVNQQPGPDRDLIATLYGLSAAESRVAEQMFAGRSAADAAESLCVNVETVRTHLKSLYVKTRSAGRGDLLRRLAYVAALRPVGETDPWRSSAQARENHPFG